MKLNDCNVLLTEPKLGIIHERLEDTELTKALTVEQVAEKLQLPETTIRKWFREGKLPAVRLGKHWRLSEDILDEYLTGKRKFAETSATDTDEKEE